MWLIQRHFFVNTLGPRQNDRHFPDDIFNCILLKENICLKFQIKCSKLYNLQYSSIGLDNGLAPTRRQAIIWTIYRLPTHVCVTRPEWVNQIIKISICTQWVKYMTTKHGELKCNYIFIFTIYFMVGNVCLVIFHIKSTVIWLFI